MSPATLCIGSHRILSHRTQPAAAKMQEWIGSFFTAPSNLQSAGEIPRDKILDFFSKGKEEVFGSAAFRDHLRQGHQKGRNAQDMVNLGQMQLWESLGVKGSFGISYLGKVRTMFANDAEMLRKFYE